jgi:hypothetical protein
MLIGTLHDRRWVLFDDDTRMMFGTNIGIQWNDGLDGKTDWPPDEHGNHPLTDLLLEDFLVVDIGKPFREDSWFEIEQAMLADASLGRQFEFVQEEWVTAGSSSARARNGTRWSEPTTGPASSRSAAADPAPRQRSPQLFGYPGRRVFLLAWPGRATLAGPAGRLAW